MSNQSQLILDIPFKTICNWMQDRRLLPQDWVKKLKAAEIKSEQLRNDFPVNHQEEAVRKLKELINSRGETFIYKDAKELFTQLIEKTDEGKQKSFLGRYKSQLVIDWQLLVRIYESDNLYLAEYGKIVQQLQGFDIPSMKKQLQSMSRQVNESQQKVGDLKRSIKEQDKKFNDECQKLGIMPTIDASSLERQSIKMVEHLIGKFQTIQKLLQDQTMRQLIDYYMEFNKDYVKEGEALQTLAYFVKNGDENVALYEFKRKNANAKVPEDLLSREEHKYDLYTRFDQIVFQETPIEIELEGAAEGNNNGTNLDIDWSQIDTNYIESDDQSKQNDVAQSWAIISEKEAMPQPKKVDLNLYNEEETLLYNQESRQLLVNDLEECEFFLKQRLNELGSKDQSTYAMYIEGHNRKEILKQCDQVEYVKKAISLIENITSLINHKDLLQLLLIRQKPKTAAQRIVQKVLAPIKLKEKYEQTIVSLEKKDKEIVKEIESMKKQVDSNEKVVKELIAIIQKDLSTKLKAIVKVSL